MPTPRVLVVDDEWSQRQLLSRFLGHTGMQVTAVPSVKQAVERVRTLKPDLALIDIALPGPSGIKLLEALRAAPETARLPVILMTGLSVPEDFAVAAAKSLGAGPIFIKGGDLHALVKRIRDALRADQSPPLPSHALARGPLLVDLDTRTASYAGRPIHLHGRSLFDLLYALMQTQTPLSREALHSRLWNQSETAGVVYVAVGRLRQALTAFPAIRIDATPDGYELVVSAPPDSLPR